MTNRNYSDESVPKIVQTIGPETKRFFERYMTLKKTGIMAGVNHAKEFWALATDEAALWDQIEIISNQTGVPADIAISGILLIRANEQTPFDPLTLPWLN